MYVKEDLIIPSHYTFYDFIITKVGRSLLGSGSASAFDFDGRP